MANIVFFFSDFGWSLVSGMHKKGYLKAILIKMKILRIRNNHIRNAKYSSNAL